MNERGLIVFNRASVPDADGWYHIMPVGELTTIAHTLAGDRRKIVEVIDQAALDAIMAEYAQHKADPEWPGYLVGIEHFSHDDHGRTEAAAWAVELKVRNSEQDPERQRGIWARLQKTPLGESIIGSTYKFFSTVNRLQLIAQNRYRPVNIEDIGLTNKPAYKTLVPAMHRDQNQQEDSTMLDTLRAILVKHKIVLVQDANEEAVAGAVDTALARLADIPALEARAVTAEHRVTELETVELDRAADVFVAQHKARITDPDKVKALFKTNRQAAEEMIALIKPPEEKDAQRVLHREGSKQPLTLTQEDADKAAERNRDQLDFVEQVKAKHRLPTMAAAWPVAQRLKPELFKEETENK